MARNLGQYFGTTAQNFFGDVNFASSIANKISIKLKKVSTKFSTFWPKKPVVEDLSFNAESLFVQRSVQRSSATFRPHTWLNKFAPYYRFYPAPNVSRYSSLLRRLRSTPRLAGTFSLIGFSVASRGYDTGQEISLEKTQRFCDLIKTAFEPVESVEQVVSPEVKEKLGNSVKEYVFGECLGLGTNAAVYEARTKATTAGREAVEDIPVDREAAEESDWEVVDGNDSTEESVAPHNNLAIKMLFNYYVMSNQMALLRASEKEQVPLQPKSNGVLPDEAWELDKHVRKKSQQPGLPPHPNIVEMYHVFTDETIPCLDHALENYPHALPPRLFPGGCGRNMSLFLVMKRYEMTLRDYLKMTGIPTGKEAALILAQILEGIAHLTVHGVAHRDLKSDNILVNCSKGKPSVVLSDFGCCLPSGLQMPYSTEETDKGGNPCLMAPEVKSALPGPNVVIDYSKADLWAVGAIAYEVLGLENPFYRGHGLNSQTYSPDQLPPLPANSDPHLARVVRLLLEREPTKRPSARVAADMLHLLLWEPGFWRERVKACSSVQDLVEVAQGWLKRLAVLAAHEQAARKTGGPASSSAVGCLLGQAEYQLFLLFFENLNINHIVDAMIIMRESAIKG